MSKFVHNHTESNQIVHGEIVRDEMTVLHARPWRDAALRLVAASALAGAAALLAWPSSQALATDPAPAAAQQGTPVSVAVLKARQTMDWSEFSGRLQAVERVDVRSRVAGAVQKVHFREGALVKQGDLLVTIDPAPFEAELAHAQSLMAAADARVSLTKSDLDRGKQLVDNKVVSIRDLDQRINASKEAEANLRAAQAAVQTAQLDLDYTSVRAPVDGRVGRSEVTVGNLVAAGPTSPVLTTLVSVDPIYVGFDADEEAVGLAMASLEGKTHEPSVLDRIPVEISTATTGGTPVRGHLQLVDNQVDVSTGTFRLRAVFDNPNGRLVPGQFARVKMGRAKEASALVINERAVGTDQDKKFVFVVDADSKAAYREVKLGANSNGLRVVASGLKEGEKIVVNGLQRVRPGALLAPEIVPMETASATKAAPDTVAVQ